MGIPIEALYPLAIVGAALAMGGVALDYTSRWFNNGKVALGVSHCIIVYVATTKNA
jgi:hypothetical protein